MNIWEQFNMEFNAEKLAKELEEETKKESNFIRREVPNGSYETAIRKLEIKESRNNKPMLACWMKIVEGEYRGSVIFMHQVITRRFQIEKVSKFLNSLISKCDEIPEVYFQDFNQYKELVMEIAELIDKKFEYQTNYFKNNKGYGTFVIEQIFPLI